MRQIIAILLIFFSAAALSAQPTGLTQHWLPHNENSTATIDHSAFTAFLQNYVAVRDNAPNLVRYAQVTPASHKALEAYIDNLAQIPLDDYNREQQLAYWLNLYNAALINLVLDYYPVDKVLDIGDAASGPWAVPVATIDSIRLTLGDIRNKILRAIWQSPTVLYGMSWAAIGGPELRAIAYIGKGIYLQLRDSAKRFVNSPQGVTIKDNQLIVSDFFDWYRQAFGGNVITLISELREHAAPALSARLDVFDKIASYKFDWNLNDAG